MARPPRFEYAGAIYHVMARGDGGRMVFETKADREAFMARLDQVCTRHGWRLHAWVLMGNHFHLLLETPEPNLVSGMKWLLGTFSQGWNRARKRRGHVFQGRYKAVPVSGSDAEGSYFRTVADYIHLNPARAGLAGGAKGKLIRYPWSSLPLYLKRSRPEWLETGRVLDAFALARDGRGRRAYADWLEARAKADGGRIDDEAMKAMRKGWYLGQDSFKDRLLKLLERSEAPSGNSRTGRALRDHGQTEALRLLGEAAAELSLPSPANGLQALAKSDERKVLVALLLRERTGVSNGWIAERLHMGHPGSVSRLAGVAAKDKRMQKRKRALAKALDGGD